MFVIGFAGCVGALRENTCLLLFVSFVCYYHIFLYTSQNSIAFPKLFVEPACGKARHSCCNFCSVYVRALVCVSRHPDLTGP